MGTKIKISELEKHASGLNIEGGYPYNHITNNGELSNKIWVNSVIVLDRPLIDNLLFDVLFKRFTDNSYTLLENVIPEINEPDFIALYCSIIMYYVYNCESLLNKDKAKIVVHVHQDKHSINLINILKKYVDDLIKQFDINTDKFTLTYTTDDFHYQNTTPYKPEDADILISLSQCAGVDRKIKAGDILITNKFIPYDIDNNVVRTDNTYYTDNHLVKTIDSVVNSAFMRCVANTINTDYVSSNKLKTQKADISGIMNKIHNLPILHVNALWNPVDEDEPVTLK